MKNEYIIRREKFISKLPKNSLTIIFAGKEVVVSEDENYPYEVNRNFFYLTGIRQENSVLLINKGIVQSSIFLLIDEFDPHKEVWTGIRLKANECQEISGIKNIDFTKNLENRIDEIILDNDLEDYNLCLDYNSTAIVDYKDDGEFHHPTYVSDFVKSIKKKYSKIKINNINPILMEQRMIKSPYEIEEIKKAIANTNHALNGVLSILKPGLKEYDISSYFSYRIAEMDNAKTAFNTIAASGKNAVILHYPHPKDELKDGDLLLLDLGAENKGYRADISRTYPINGTFTPLQKKIYQIVLRCNKETIKYAKPGLTIYELQDFATNFMTGELISEGLILNQEEIRKYYYHNVSHHLGIDTHDLSDRSMKLRPGMVITVEPGLYFKEYGIGIRIEDDVLITENGVEVLSKDIIKEIDDIENAMKRK